VTIALLLREEIEGFLKIYSDLVDHRKIFPRQLQTMDCD